LVWIKQKQPISSGFEVGGVYAQGEGKLTIASQSLLQLIADFQVIRGLEYSAK
jgi:hypothetical protein